LHVSQPAVSQALRQLEDHLGTRLLDRSTRPATLTAAGRVLHRATVEGLGHMTEALDRIDRLGRPHGTVTLSCPVEIAACWLMPRLAAFCDSQPDIAVCVQTQAGDAPALTPGIDLVLRCGAGEWRDGVVHRLFRERYAPVCAPALADRVRDSGPGGPSPFGGVPLIEVTAETACRMSWDSWFRARNLGSARPGPIHTVPDPIAASHAALAGEGVMLGSIAITGDLVTDGALIGLPEDAVRTDAGLWWVEPAGADQNPARTAVAEWLETLALPEADRDDDAQTRHSGL
jgi:DNA-binding transcriptional LysR family regulator